MYHFCVDFQMSRFIRSFPTTLRLAMETQFSSDYHCMCGNRHGGLFVYTLEGRGVFRKNGKDYALLPGTAYALCGSDERIEYYYPEDSSEPWKFIWIAFEGELFETILSGIIETYGHIYKYRKKHPLIEKLMTYQSCSKSETILSPDEYGKIIYGVLNSLAESSERGLRKEESHDIVSLVKRLIAEGLPSGISPDEIAGKLGISREHMGRVFKESCGLTVIEYILRQKMFYASYLLKESTRSIKEISAECGYETESNFCRAFKTYSGETPRSFRLHGSIHTIY